MTWGQCFGCDRPSVQPDALPTAVTTVAMEHPARDSAKQRVVTSACLKAGTLLLSLLLGCQQFVDPKDVAGSELSCYSIYDKKMEGVVAWCDPGHFHVTFPFEGGTVYTSTQSDLPSPLVCPVMPDP